MSCPPPVNPISVCDASPGPLTTHPIIDKLIGFFIWDSFFSNFLTVSITGKACLAQDGQEIMLTPLDLIPKDFKFHNPFTSSTGSEDKETLIVSPIPCIKSCPIPIEDLMLPVNNPPASVTPKCRG